MHWASFFQIITGKVESLIMLVLQVSPRLGPTGESRTGGHAVTVCRERAQIRGRGGMGKGLSASL